MLFLNSVIDSVYDRCVCLISLIYKNYKIFSACSIINTNMVTYFNKSFEFVDSWQSALCNFENSGSLLI